MKKSSLNFYIVIALILSVQQASAVGLSFNVSNPTLGLNDTTDVSVWISGMGDHDEPSLGGYDLSIGFNSSVLRLESIGFESFLGHPGIGSSSSQSVSPGILNVLEVSFLDIPELDLLQPDTFPLVSLQFRMMALENSTLNFLNTDLSDGYGSAIPASIQSVDIYAVPLPSTLLLLSGAVLGIGTFRRVNKSRQLKG